MTVEAKICGVNSEDALNAAIEGAASYVGFVFYPRSPRSLTPTQAADLAALVPSTITKVGLLVDPDDATLTPIVEEVALDMLQLHGGETPERVADIKMRTGLQVMKAIKVESDTDVDAASAYEAVSDRVLFDAKVPKDMKGALPGGNAVSFDWRLLAGRRWACPWMLSGGLDADNVAEAVRISGASAVDVSSGVESSPGVKDPKKIAAFLAAVSAI